MSGPRRRAAVLGAPIAHSLSPALHRAAYAALGLDWRYDAIEVDEAALPAFLGGLGPEWVGLSLTMPLKRTVLPLLDQASELSGLVQAANTVLLEPDGRRTGHNTDVPGMVTALAGALDLARGPSPAVAGLSADTAPADAGLSAHMAPAVAGLRRGTVLGGGATARSALAALARLGVHEVLVVLRRPEAAGGLHALAERLDLRLAVSPWPLAEDALAADVVVATVPGGVADDLVAGVPARPGALLDVAYTPWPTALAAAWARAGGPVASGLDLLLWQAVEQVRMMTGQDPPVAAMQAALERPIPAPPAR